MYSGAQARRHADEGEIWWSNGTFFIAIHLFAIFGAVHLSPLSALSWKTAVLCFISWQLASFGITIGYHRLWSHRAFTATAPLRILLAWMGSMGFQGSIKWWVLRHRLHHRFTDSPAHDPYSATKGLWFSHCGWIFRKPSYPRMKLIERADLVSDPIVRFQHRHYIPIALFSGLILPSLIAHFGWNDWLGGLVWGGAVARLLIWHTTFCINSLAHWTGLQPYSEEMSARGNYLLALLTSGEGNHNFHHAFPKDFRNGPHPADWDPSKWFIWGLHKYTPLVPTIARTPESAVNKARARVHMAQATRLTEALPPHEKVKAKDELPVWTREEVRRRHGAWVMEEHGVRRRVLVILEGCVVDVGGYLDDHPGGSDLLLSHSVYPLSSEDKQPQESSTPEIDSGYTSSDHPSPTPIVLTSLALPSTQQEVERKLRSAAHNAEKDGFYAEENVDSDTDADVEGEGEGQGEVLLKDATRAFFGGMNNHSGAAKEWMRCLRVARLANSSEEDDNKALY